MAAVTGAFTASGQSGALLLLRPAVGAAMPFNVSLWGTFSATAALERSFDGITWLPVTYPDGTALAWTTPVSTGWQESEDGVNYRLNCTWTSGTMNYRVSQ